jgi:hypothetical protein
MKWEPFFPQKIPTLSLKGRTERSPPYSPATKSHSPRFLRFLDLKSLNFKKDRIMKSSVDAHQSSTGSKVVSEKQIDEDQFLGLRQRKGPIRILDQPKNLGINAKSLSSTQIVDASTMEDIYFDLIAMEREEVDEHGRSVPWLNRIAKHLSDEGWLVGESALNEKNKSRFQNDRENDIGSHKGKGQGKSDGNFVARDLDTLLSVGTLFRKTELSYKISLPSPRLCPIPVNKASGTHPSSAKFPTNDIFVLDGAFPTDWCDRLTPSPVAVKRGIEVVVMSEPLATAIFAKVHPWLPKTLIVNDDSFALACIIPLFRFIKIVPKTNFVRPILQDEEEEDVSSRSNLFPKHPITGKPGRFRALVTIVTFLNDGEEYEGGELTFLHARQCPDSDAVSVDMIGQVQPVRGRCAVFQRDQHHEYKDVISGTKLIFQCDVAYEQV